jgi:uncharacterized protein (DUF362 family)
MDDISRREFIQRLLVLGAGVAGAGGVLSGAACSSDQSTQVAVSSPVDSAATRSPTTRLTTPSPSARPYPTPSPRTEDAYLAAVRGGDPSEMVDAALRAIGGMGRFVKMGDDVIIKPNICVAYHSYEYAATTNPQVVGALVSACVAAGARRVRVMDQPFGGTPEQAYQRSGIGEAVRAAGGMMETMAPMKFQETTIPEGRDITSWSVFQDVLKADVLIDVPIAKHHGLATLTLGMKNLMGVIQNRGGLHRNLGQRIADLTSLVRPTLTVVDAVRILRDNGPTGGDLNDVELANTVIASHDIIAADTYAASLFGLTLSDVPALEAGAEMGLGTSDLSSLRVVEISL